MVHALEDSARTEGTSVTVPLPASIDLDAAEWVRGYALVNPHASFTVAEHGQDDDAEDPEIYKATARDGWRKPVPADPTSAWWYDGQAFMKLAASLAAVGDDRPVGAFVAEFRGLSGTGKHKQIAAAVPGVKRISDLAKNSCRRIRPAAGDEGWPARSRRSPSSARSPRSITAGCSAGSTGWSGTGTGTAAWSTTASPGTSRSSSPRPASPGETFYACNYAVSFGDPLADIRLTSAEVSAFGAGSFLARCDAMPDYPNDHRRAAVVHVTCGAPVFTDKGKVKLVVPDDGSRCVRPGAAGRPGRTCAGKTVPPTGPSGHTTGRPSGPARRPPARR